MTDGVRWRSNTEDTDIKNKVEFIEEFEDFWHLPLRSIIDGNTR